MPLFPFFPLPFLKRERRREKKKEKPFLFLTSSILKENREGKRKEQEFLGSCFQANM